MESIRLLIIEKNPRVREALAARLSSSPGLEVLATSETAADGLRESATQAPDVVLLDARTAGQSGDLSQSIRALKDQPSRVIVLTSFADELERRAALEAGAERYSLKDIDSTALIEMIQELVQAPG